MITGGPTSKQSRSLWVYARLWFIDTLTCNRPFSFMNARSQSHSCLWSDLKDVVCRPKLNTRFVPRPNGSEHSALRICLLVPQRRASIRHCHSKAVRSSLMCGVGGCCCLWRPHGGQQVDPQHHFRSWNNLDNDTDHGRRGNSCRQLAVVCGLQNQWHAGAETAAHAEIGHRTCGQQICGCVITTGQLPKRLPRCQPQDL